jgi:beta-glucosidase
MQWPILAQALTDLLVDVNAAYQPGTIYITENGAAFNDQVVDGAVNDPRRVQYLHDHIDACRAAIDEGVPLKGYFAWSLLDNFEWAYGFSKRFGLIYVDYTTLDRIPKASYYWYKRTIAANAVQPVE